MHHPRYSALRAHGFSLVEIAVVLVIIGLILAAVLQGRQLIAGAQYKSFKSQLRGYATAFYAFRDRYNALPGDFDDADDRLDLSGANGDGDGVIEGGPTCDGASEEACLAWQHLRAADLISGNPNDTGSSASPQHPYGGVVSGFFTGSDGNGQWGHKIEIVNLPTDIAEQLDQDIDDEQCDDGRIAAQPNSDCDSGPPVAWPSGKNQLSIIYAL